jgi:hypothetical protein
MVSMYAARFCMEVYVTQQFAFPYIRQEKWGKCQQRFNFRNASFTNQTQEVSINYFSNSTCYDFMYTSETDNTGIFILY